MCKLWARYCGLSSGAGGGIDGESAGGVVSLGAGFTVVAPGLATLPAGLVVPSLVVTSETFFDAGADFCCVAVTVPDPAEGLTVPAAPPAGWLAIAAGVPVRCGLGAVAGGGIWAEVAAGLAPVDALPVEFAIPLGGLGGAVPAIAGGFVPAGAG